MLTAKVVYEIVKVLPKEELHMLYEQLGVAQIKNKEKKIKLPQKKQSVAELKLEIRNRLLESVFKVKL